MRLFRVFPYDTSAAEDQPGGALFVPPGSAGRIDNPDLYQALYLASHPETGIAEVLGELDTWSDRLLVHPRLQLRYALAEYELPDSEPICDLDDAHELLRLGMRPSDVVVRDRARSQAWARAIFNRGDCSGITWWSYFEPSWHVYALWERRSLRLIGRPRELTIDSSEVRAAAQMIVRGIEP